MTKSEKADIAKKPVEEIDAIVTRYAMAAHKRAKKLAVLHKKMAEFREQHKDHFEEIATLGTEMETLSEVVCAWLTQNRMVLNGKKSLDLTNATIGIHQNPASVGTSKGTSAASVIDYLKSVLQEPGLFIRTKSELNKEAIKDAWENNRDLFERAGLQLKDSETFFIEPKAESIPQGG